MHDDGSAETTEFLYDARRGIVYAYGEDDFSCANGNPEKAGILEAVYATGNKAGMPVGSGYYIVGLNAGQCAAKKAGTAASSMQTIIPLSVAQSRSTTPLARLQSRR